MLDMMMQKTYLKRRKIIKVYGKEALAGMFLDLLNVKEGQTIPKRILSPLSGKVPKGMKLGGKKREWNPDNTLPPYRNNLKMKSESIFNLPNPKKGSQGGSRQRRNLRNRNFNNSRPTSLDRSREDGRSFGEGTSIVSSGSKVQRVPHKSYYPKKKFNRSHISPDPGQRNTNFFSK